MKIGQSHACICQAIQIGRADFAAEGAQITETQIIGNNQQHVGLLRFARKRRFINAR